MKDLTFDRRGQSKERKFFTGETLSYLLPYGQHQKDDPAINGLRRLVVVAVVLLFQQQQQQ